MTAMIYILYVADIRHTLLPVQTLTRAARVNSNLINAANCRLKPRPH